MPIKLINPFSGLELYPDNGNLRDACGDIFVSENGVYRVVKGSNYTENFGFQWNKFVRTQIDRGSEITQSHNRFFAETKWDVSALAGVNVLEVGSGAGRFSQVVLDHTSAVLYSVDYSNAVEANFRNNGHHGDRLKLFQASIYELPFAKQSFDKVFCFGVLQHTPDFERSVSSLAAMVKPGGELVVDFYPIRGWWTKTHIKYLIRPLTKRVPHEKLLKMIERNVDWMILVSKLALRLGIYRLACRFIPIAGITQFPSGLSAKELREWVVLDTFDMFSPEFDQPQRVKTVARWFRKSGLDVTFSGFVRTENSEAATVRGIRPVSGRCT